jgi:outer membrane protein OmpU
MNKILLATTALVSLFAASAFAEAPVVTVGGSLDFQAGFTDDDVSAAGSSDTKFANDTRVNVKAQGKADNGITYGGVIELLADVTEANDDSGFNADRTYLFLESNAGRVEMGSNVGAAKTLKVDASTFARATGGIDGDWYRYVDGASTGQANFLATPDLPVDGGIDGRGDTENATKITYYSPRFSGFQVGGSYTPDTGNRGTAAAFTATGPDEFRDAFDLGLNYTTQYNQVGIAASATGQFGSAELSTEEDLRAYALGLTVNFAGFTVGGSYADLGESGLTSGTAGDQNYWTLGGAYVQGPIGASVTYFNSERVGDEFDNISVGADYQLAPGFVPYAEVSFFNVEPAAGTDTDGTVFILGTQLTF